MGRTTAWWSLSFPKRERNKLQESQPPLRHPSGLIWFGLQHSQFPWVAYWRQHQSGNLIFPRSCTGETPGLSRMKEWMTEKKVSRLRVRVQHGITMLWWYTHFMGKEQCLKGTCSKQTTWIQKGIQKKKPMRVVVRKQDWRICRNCKNAE